MYSSIAALGSVRAAEGPRQAHPPAAHCLSSIAAVFVFFVGLAPAVAAAQQGHGPSSALPSVGDNRDDLGTEGRDAADDRASAAAEERARLEAELAESLELTP